MSKKNIAALVSAVLLIAAAVAAIIIFHARIAAFLEVLKTKPRKSADPSPHFTPEERESFADI